MGANSTGVEITGTAASEQGLHLFNTGTIDAAQATSTAIRANADNSLDSYVVNVGSIMGNIAFGAGNDRLMNTVFVDNTGRVIHSGNIIMNGSVIDFGAGENRFDNDRGLITIVGRDNLITGADLFMTRASIEARNNSIGDSLTIDGNLSGAFTFGADFSERRLRPADHHRRRGGRQHDERRAPSHRAIERRDDLHGHHRRWREQRGRTGDCGRHRQLR